MVEGEDFDTRLIHADREADDYTAAPVIPYSATFVASSREQFGEMASKPMHPRFYTRFGNPLHARVERLIAAIERGEAGLLASSGMGAISSTILALVSKGDHVVAQSNHYVGTRRVLAELLPRFGAEVTYVDQTRSEEFEAAIRPTTRLILTETPVNPTLELTDLAAVARIARARGILTFCDNTFATPVNQTPLQLGIDIVAHSATKYMGGHHDLIAGAIVSSRELIERIWSTMTILGPTLSPMDAWLLLRGLRTLSLRVHRQNETALKVASFLESHPAVARVHYPGLASHPQRALAGTQMKGFGGVLSFELKGELEQTAQLVSRLKLPRNAVSLGGVETLILHAATAWSGSMSEEQMRAAGILPNLVRMAFGLENADDLIRDLEHGLSGVR